MFAFRIPAIRRPTQFTLLGMFEYTTVCCILASFSWATGIASAAGLMAMALALMLRQGLAAIMLLMAAILLAGMPMGVEPARSAVQEFASMLAALCLGGWYRLRNGAAHHAESASCG